MLAPQPSGVTRVVLLRHGEPEKEAHGRVYGRLDVGLSARGRVQVEAAAAWLAELPLAAIYASPRRRAIESAEPLSRLRKLAVQVREDLRELDFGALEGLGYDEAQRLHPALYAEWMAHPTSVEFPGGESYPKLRARVLGELMRLRAAHPDRSFALVAHGGVTRAILADALGLLDEHLFRLDQSYAAVSVIDYFPESAVVRLVNGTAP